PVALGEEAERAFHPLRRLDQPLPIGILAQGDENAAHLLGERLAHAGGGGPGRGVSRLRTRHSYGGSPRAGGGGGGRRGSPDTAGATPRRRCFPRWGSGR